MQCAFLLVPKQLKIGGVKAANYSRFYPHLHVVWILDEIETLPR